MLTSTETKTPEKTKDFFKHGYYQEFFLSIIHPSTIVNIHILSQILGYLGTEGDLI